jgi:hypothetical protein
MLLATEGGFTEQDIIVTGYSNEFLLKNMTPLKWTFVRNLVSQPNKLLKIDGKDPKVTPPLSYLNYDDLATVLTLRRFGPQGILPPGDVAISLERTNRSPQPWRIHRMYHAEARIRLNMVRVTWRTTQERSFALTPGFLKINGEKCTLKAFHSKETVMRPCSAVGRIPYPDPQSQPSSNDQTAPA